MRDIHKAMIIVQSQNMKLQSELIKEIREKYELELKLMRKNNDYSHLEQKYQHLEEKYHDLKKQLNGNGGDKKPR